MSDRLLSIFFKTHIRDQELFLHFFWHVTNDLSTLCIKLVTSVHCDKCTTNWFACQSNCVPRTDCMLRAADKSDARNRRLTNLSVFLVGTRHLITMKLAQGTYTSNSGITRLLVYNTWIICQSDTILVKLDFLCGQMNGNTRQKKNKNRTALQNSLIVKTQSFFKYKFRAYYAYNSAVSLLNEKFRL